MSEDIVPLPLRVHAVLFDLDGTLADTAGDLAAALNAVRAECGLDPIDAAALRAYASAGARGMLGAGMGLTPTDDRYERLRESFLGHYATMLAQTTRLFDGVDDLLTELDQRGLPWGIVTNKVGRFTTPVVAALGLERRARTVICGDTTPHPKPHPAPLLHAAQALLVSPENCIYVGDDLRDVVAGNAAGMGSIIAGWGYLGGEQHPSTWPAAASAARPADLLELFRLA